MVQSKPARGAAAGLVGRRISDSPDSFRSRTVGIVIPLAGPKVADLRPDSIWGEEVECLRARRCRMGGTDGDDGTSSVPPLTKSEEFVLRLS